VNQEPYGSGWLLVGSRTDFRKSSNCWCGSHGATIIFEISIVEILGLALRRTGRYFRPPNRGSQADRGEALGAAEKWRPELVRDRCDFGYGNEDVAKIRLNWN
jgi:hypothetical protein